MSQTLKLTNYPVENIIEETLLNADMAAGTSMTVRDNQGFSADDFILIGNKGSETGEIRTVATVNADLVSVTITAATKLAHDRFEPVYKLFGDQMKLYRAANVDGSIPANASFSVVATIDIDPDQQSTAYTDSTGSSDYWYKRTFYNQTSTEETPLADAPAYRGAQYPAYATIEQIRNKAGLENNRWITDEKVDEKRRSAQSIIDARLQGTYTVPFTPPVNQLINEITQLYAAGLLLTQSYSVGGAGVRTQGETMLNEVTNDNGTGLLDKLDSQVLRLTDLTGTSETSTVAAIGYSSWPNDSTETADYDDGGDNGPGFRRSTRY